MKAVDGQGSYTGAPVMSKSLVSRIVVLALAMTVAHGALVTASLPVITSVTWNPHLRAIHIELDCWPGVWPGWRMYIDGAEIPMEGRPGAPEVRPDAPLEQGPSGLLVGTLPWLAGLDTVDFPCCGTVQLFIPGHGYTNTYEFNLVAQGCRTGSDKQCPLVVEEREPWTLPRGAQPSDLLLTPDGSRIYTSAMGSSNVYVVDAESQEIMEVIDLTAGEFTGLWPFRLSISPDGRIIYAATPFSENICVIDTLSNEVVDTIYVGAPVREAVFAGDGEMAYVDVGRDYVPVVEVGTGEVNSNVALLEGDQSYTLAPSPDGQRMYVLGAGGGGRVYVVDVEQNKVEEHFDLGRELTNQGIVTVSADGSKLYLPSGITGSSYARPHEGANRIYVVDLLSRSVVSEIEVPGGPISLALTPDDDFGYVSTFAAGEVYVVDLSEYAVVGEIDWNDLLAGEEQWRRRDLRRLVADPEGNRLYITAWDADGVLVADLNARLMTGLLPVNRAVILLRDVAIASDGSRLFVSSHRVGRGGVSGVFVIDISTGALLDTILMERPPNKLLASPDGELIYAVYRDQVIAWDVRNLARARDIHVEGARDLSDIALIPGTDMAYATDADTDMLHVVNIAAEEAVTAVDVGWRPLRVVVTPDGSKAYVLRGNNRYDDGGLVVLDPSTHEVIARRSPPIGTGPSGGHDLLGTTPDGESVLWANENQWVSMSSTRDHSLVRVIDLATDIEREMGNPRGIAPSDVEFCPGGLYAYILCGDAYYVAIIELGTGRIVGRITGVGLKPNRLSISQDGTLAYVANAYSEDITVVDLISREIVDHICVWGD